MMELEERLKPFELVTDEETSVTEAFDDVPCGSASQILLINADEVKDQQYNTFQTRCNDNKLNLSGSKCKVLQTHCEF